MPWIRHSAPKQRMIVQFDRVGAHFKPHIVDGRDLPNWREGPVMAEFLRNLRRNGWRLITLPNSDCTLLERE